MPRAESSAGIGSGTGAVACGDPEQITSDPTGKTQPAWFLLGDRIEFTVFSYRAHFWRTHPCSLAR